MRQQRRRAFTQVAVIAFCTFALTACDKEQAGSAVGSASGGAGGASNAGSASSTGSADDQAAREFFQGKLEERWVKTDDGWTMQLQRRNGFGEPMDGLPGVLFLQYRDFKYSVKRLPLDESQKLNGTTYCAEVSFQYVPTRRYHTEASIEARPGWSAWDEEQPAASLIVERRNDKWLMTDAEMLNCLKPDPAAIPK